LPARGICSDDDTGSTESDGDYDSHDDSDVVMCKEDDVDAPDSVDLDDNGNGEVLD